MHDRKHRTSISKLPLTRVIDVAAIRRRLGDETRGCWFSSSGATAFKISFARIITTVHMSWWVVYIAHIPLGADCV